MIDEEYVSEEDIGGSCSKESKGTYIDEEPPKRPTKKRKKKTRKTNEEDDDNGIQKKRRKIVKGGRKTAAITDWEKIDLPCETSVVTNGEGYVLVDLFPDIQPYAVGVDIGTVHLVISGTDPHGRLLKFLVVSPSHGLTSSSKTPSHKHTISDSCLFLTDLFTNPKHRESVLWVTNSPKIRIEQQVDKNPPARIVSLSLFTLWIHIKMLSIKSTYEEGQEEPFQYTIAKPRRGKKPKTNRKRHPIEVDDSNTIDVSFVGGDKKYSIVQDYNCSEAMEDPLRVNRSSGSVWKRARKQLAVNDMNLILRSLGQEDIAEFITNLPIDQLHDIADSYLIALSAVDRENQR